jgi:hypothetical protein
MLRSIGFDPCAPFSEDLKMISNTTERVNDSDTFRVTIEELVMNGATNDEIVASLGRQGLQTSTRSLKR